MEPKQSSSNLATIDPSEHQFIKPAKRINDGSDLHQFLSSRAYNDIGRWIMQLNTAICPHYLPSDPTKIQTWPLGNPDVIIPGSARNIQELLEKLSTFIDEAPPDPGPRRFGNVAFRKWFGILESRVGDLLDKHLPNSVLGIRNGGEAIAKDELTEYLLGGFGSAQRLDYGTGHELSFLAFLGCIWKLGGFADSSEVPTGNTERSIVLGIVEPYLRVIRRLILTYNLEPAGSHGVWGLDDHAFLPYIFGSSQYCPAIKDGDTMPVQGSLDGAPKPDSVVKKLVVDRERETNMYFSAIGFIYDVKKGPFWEHSPILFDISGIQAGWGKINKGMIKMYNAEVLSKFPVVQHFPFGSLFSFETEPNAPKPEVTTHVANQPSSQPALIPGGISQSRPPPQAETAAPWTRTLPGEPQKFSPATSMPAPWAAGSSATTAAPWAKNIARQEGRGPPQPPLGGPR